MCTRTKFPCGNFVRVHTQLPGMLSHPLTLSDLASGSTGPKSSLHQPPLSNHRLSLTVANSYLLIALGPCLSSSSSSLIENLAHKPFVWVSRQNRQRNPLTGAYPHPQNKCPPSCHIMFKLLECFRTLLLVIWFCQLMPRIEWSFHSWKQNILTSWQYHVHILQSWRRIKITTAE